MTQKTHVEVIDRIADEIERDKKTIDDHRKTVDGLAAIREQIEKKKSSE